MTKLNNLKERWDAVLSCMGKKKIANRNLFINFINPNKEVIAKYFICKNCENFCSLDHIK